MNQSTRHFGAAVVLFLGAFVFGLAISGGAQSTPGTRGLQASRTDNERILEQELQNIPSAAKAESNLRHLTSEPHMAGTEANHRVAEWLRDQYQSYGFDAEIVTYNAWLPLPREVKLELTAPERKTLGSPEQPFEEDPDTYNAKVAPGFNTYSPSGDVTAPIVYANYGMPDDYRELESLGISVEGKIVIARYGQGFRGIKAKVAEEHKAAGLIIYSDPQDDGYTVGDTFPRGPWRPMSGIQRGSILYTQIYPGDPLTARRADAFGREACGSRRCLNARSYSHHAHQRQGRRSDSFKPRRKACAARMAGRSAFHLPRRPGRRSRAHENRHGLPAAPDL